MLGTSNVYVFMLTNLMYTLLTNLFMYEYVLKHVKVASPASDCNSLVLK